VWNFFHCSNGYTNASQCYVIHRMSIFICKPPQEMLLKILSVNGTLGMEWGVANELTRSKFNSRYIKFALTSGVQHRIREADNSPPCRAEDKNGWK
jgi:hypothetical protein